MRHLTIGLLAATALGCISSAQAADFADDYLRGPEYEPVAAQTIDWNGFYIGGHGGYSSSGLGFKNVFDTITAQTLNSVSTRADTSALSFLSSYETRASGATYGAFVGYNFAYDDLVLGIEGDYSWFGQSGNVLHVLTARSPVSNGSFDTLYLAGHSSTKLLEYGTIRTRIGYAFDNVLPYITAGVAVGSAKAVDLTVAEPYTTFLTTPPSNVAGAPVGYYRTKFDLVAGLAVGAGIEYAISSNFLVRGEYQYISFDKINGHYFDVNTVRAGAAYKF